MKKFEVGQSIYLKPVGNDFRNQTIDVNSVEKCKIAKIGRKYFYVDCGYGDQIKFTLDDMREFSEYSASWEAYHSLQDIFDEENKKTMCKDISCCFTYNSSSLNFDQVKRIHEITCEDKQIK